MVDLPAGTVTFLFTDIAGSTQLLQQLGAERYGNVLAAQRAILRAAFKKYNGREIDTQGDAFFVSFRRATEAVAAVVQMQRALTGYDWPEGIEMRVRMGLHTGEPLVAEEGYVGMDVHRAARIAHVGHGGQVLLSEATVGLLKRDLPEGIGLKDLGEYQLKDLRTTWRLYQIIIADLPSEFPDLKAKLIKPPSDPTARKPIPLPAFLEGESAADLRSQPVFVARERELERLDKYLEQALSGHGQVAFITGGPGQGKTALLQAFARRAMTRHPELLVASGQCNAFTGTGDPYLPFRDVLTMLTGDVESRWAAGDITIEHARRTWEVLPGVTEILVESGSDLVDVLVSGHALLARAEIAAEDAHWLTGLREMVEREGYAHRDLDQTSLFGQAEQVLRAVAHDHPLLITLDDLQWADAASLNLLFHLGRRLVGDRIMILGDFRPEEVAVGRGGNRHPLEKVLAEFKRQYGEVLIELGEDESGGVAFIDALVDTEPNRLSTDFRAALYRKTQGHPLFTVELLRDLQERGALVRDEAGDWIEGRQLDWDILPAKVEGVIEERIGRLETELREILTVASVEGADFTAQVVARVQEMQERGLLRRLNMVLDRQHQLVQERGQQTVAQQRLYQYRFRHALFQQHLYNGLATSERELLHAEVGAVLEALYETNAEEIAPQLAWHFSEAGEVERAVPYLLQAGDRARRLFAHQEALDLYEQALAHQKGSGQIEAAASTLMRLGLTHQAGFNFRRSRRAFEESFVLRRQALDLPVIDLPPAPHALRLFWREPVALDPSIISDENSERYISELFSGLLSYGGSWTAWAIQPEIAHSWEVSDDGRRYVFHLRDDSFWTDGQPVTAHDFEYAWKRVLNPKTGGQAVELIYAIRGARAFHQGKNTDPDSVAVWAVAPHTLEVELDEPAGYFLNLLASARMAPVPRHVVEHRREAWTEPGNIVTNGPFFLQEWRPGEKITLARNPDYFGDYRGNLEQVVFIMQNIDAPMDQLAAYRSAQVDMLQLMPEIYHARQQHAAEYFYSETPKVNFLGFGLIEPPFHDQRVRQALALAIDRDELVAQVLNGQDLPATGGFLPPGFPGHSPDIGLPHNPERARELLAEAGYPKGKGFPQVDLLAPGLTQTSVAAALQRFWDQHLGVQVNLVFMDWRDFLEHFQQAPLYLMGWGPEYPDPDYFLRVGIRWLARIWRHVGYDQLIQAATRSFDQAERLRLYRRADRILMEEAAIVPTIYHVGHYLFKPWLKNIARNELLMKNVILEPHEA